MNMIGLIIGVYIPMIIMLFLIWVPDTALMTHLLLWGNAYAKIIRNGKGEVVALYPLMPNKMTVDRDESGRLYYRYQHSSDEANTTKEAVCILLTLLRLRIKTIRLGPTLPAFLSPSIIEILMENFGIAPITTPEDDLKALLG